MDGGSQQIKSHDLFWWWQQRECIHRHTAEQITPEQANKRDNERSSAGQVGHWQSCCFWLAQVLGQETRVQSCVLMSSCCRCSPMMISLRLGIDEKCYFGSLRRRASKRSSRTRTNKWATNIRGRPPESIHSAEGRPGQRKATEGDH